MYLIIMVHLLSFHIYISKHEHLAFNIPIYNPLPSNLPSNSWTMEESQCQFKVIICCKFIALLC